LFRLRATIIRVTNESEQLAAAHVLQRLFTIIHVENILSQHNKLILLETLKQYSLILQTAMTAQTIVKAACQTTNPILTKRL
jgi:hypothetical protein